MSLDQVDLETKLTEEKGKYRLPSNFTKSAVVWNLHRAREHTERGLVVVEGFFGAMKVHQAGSPNVVALMGSSLSDQQEQLLLRHSDRIALMFDADDAGTEGKRAIWKPDTKRGSRSMMLLLKKPVR